MSGSARRQHARERALVARYLGSDISMTSLGREFGVSRERVRQLLARHGITAQTRAAIAAAAAASPCGQHNSNGTQGAVLSSAGVSSSAPLHGAHSAGCGRR